MGRDLWTSTLKAIRKIVPARTVASWLRLLGRPLYDFGYNVHSQNGEDGIIEELFFRLGIGGGWIVEFGAWDGINYSNTYRLVERGMGFSAVYFEGDEARFEDLKATAARANGRITPVCSYVQPEGDHSLARLLEKTSVPSDFELLSIDVDGMDYHIWDRFAGFTPKVVIIEINSSVPPHIEQLHGGKFQGSSFLSTLKLGVRKGYTPVSHSGNLFFVREDLLGKLNLSPENLSNPVSLFRKDWLSKS